MIRGCCSDVRVCVLQGVAVAAHVSQAAFLEEKIDTYEHAFQVKPEGATADTWILCPDSVADSEEWIAKIKA